jgi:hypothetical protein
MAKGRKKNAAGVTISPTNRTAAVTIQIQRQVSADSRFMVEPSPPRATVQRPHP